MEKRWLVLGGTRGCALVAAILVIFGRQVSEAQTSGLVAAYAFTEGSGTTVADASGNGFTGTISGATWTASGKYTSALVFNGTSALVTIPSAPALQLTTGMTLEAWVYPTAISNTWRDVIYKGDDNYYLEGMSPQSSTPALGGTFSPNPLYGTGALAANSWTHLAATYDGATMRLYVNGVQVASRAQTGTMASSTNPLQIGGDTFYGQNFQGRIDEVRVYNRALSQAEIQTDMNTPISTEPPPPPALAISPSVTALTFTRTMQFTANTTGVIWLVDGVQGGSSTSGTISSTGLYTPPGTVGTHTVTVKTSDLTQSANATVYITNHPGVFTHHMDNMRTGQNLNEWVLTPSAVGSSSFGKLISYPLDGLTFASPLYVANVNIPGQGYHNVVYVVTEHNSVYAFDADALNTSPLWHVSFLGPGVTTVPCGDTGECGDIPNEIGITSTPVIDQGTGTIYVVAKTKEGNNYFVRLHALDISTGAEKFGGPVVVDATVPGSGTGSQGNQLPFSPLHENQRTALLLSNGVVYFAFASHGDVQPYHGWVFGYNASTLQRTLAWCATPDNEGAGIWQSGGGLATDASGDLYFATGDGTFTVDRGGIDYGDSYVRLSPSGTVTDYFTPYDQQAIDVGNVDLCAGGVILLPDQQGAHPHIMIGSGKNGTVYVLDRDNMGHFNPSDNSHAIQTFPDIFENFANPVYFNGRVYFSPIGGTMQGFSVSNGLLSSGPVTQTAENFGYPGGEMMISANGTSNGILWAVQRNGATDPGVLYAYNPSDLSTVYYSSNQAGSRDQLDAAAKFTIPLVVNGKVFVASSGQLSIFGGLSPVTITVPAPPVLASPANGATGVTTSPTLTWNASTGATTYRVQVSTDPGFVTTVVDQANITSTSFATSGLLANTVYYWHVNASNTAGTSAYTTAWSFTTAGPPPPPVLASPANGATGVATNPTLAWNASTGATSYHIQVSVDPGFATTVIDQANITTTSHAASTLAGNTLYYWRVNASSGGGTSAYSTAWSFTTAAPPPPPPAPVLASPANGATGVANNPTLTWNASTGATSYHLQVSLNSGFSTTALDQANITTTSFALTGLTANTVYYWHVSASNSGGSSAYSSAWSFTTAALPAGLIAAYAFDEGTGTTVSDKSGNNLAGTIVGATWTTGGKYGNALSFNGTSSYVDLGNPTQLQITGSMTWSAWVKAAANPPDDGQIIAKSNDQSGWQLKTSPDTGPHTFGVALSGSSGSHTQRYSTTVRSLNTWYFVAGVYNATARTLDIYVNGVLDDGTLSGTVPASQVTPAANVNIGRRAPGAYGGFYFNGIIDEVRIYNRALSQSEIQTDMNTPLGAPPSPPAAPVLASPANSATGVATNPALTWNASTGATSYRLQLSTDPGFATTVVDQANITGTTYTASSLAASTLYYWHVYASNGGGNSAYSPAWSFTTAAPPPPPPTPVLASPANGATGVSTGPTLTWNASTGATSYHLQVSTDPGFATFVLDQANIAATSYAVSGLNANTLYYWQVNATNAGGTSAYSSPWSFTTSAVPAGLVAAYSFDEGAGTTVADKSGNNLTGTIAGATWTTAGKYGNALSFNGTSALVSVPNASVLQLTSGMTLEAWVYPTVVNNLWRDVVYKGDDNYYLESTSPQNSAPGFGGTFSPNPLYGTSALAANTWSHLAGTYDGATMRLYLNGTLVASRAQTGSLATSTNPLQIGGDALYGQNFQGRIDEVRVYNRALSQSEIQSDMNASLSTLGAAPALIAAAVQTTAMVIPTAYSLNQNFPNPFNPSTVIRYAIPDLGNGGGATNVRLVVYNILGQEVAVLVDEQRAPGLYDVRFDGTNLSSGMYICRITAGKYVESRKMLLTK